MAYLTTRMALGLALQAQHLVLDGLRVDLEVALVSDLHLPATVDLALGERLASRSVVRFSGITPHLVSKLLSLHRHLFELIVPEFFEIHALQGLLQLVHVGGQGFDILIMVIVRGMADCT